MSNNSDKISFDDAIEKLSKNVYLEDPDIWIKLTEKLNDNIFDEMVLFFAVKYNLLPIIKYVIENKLIDLNLKSQNKEYENIGIHLISIALKSNNTSIHNYLTEILGLNNNLNTKKFNKDNIQNNNIDDIYIPEYICPYCNLNIFACGYKVKEDVVYKFCSNENMLIEDNRQSEKDITCCNCNNIINNITSENLKDLSKLQNCTKCLNNLTTIGIIDKSNMVFDNKSNTFIKNNTTFHCGNCDKKISEKQKKYFNLQ